MKSEMMALVKIVSLYIADHIKVVNFSSKSSKFDTNVLLEMTSSDSHSNNSGQFFCWYTNHRNSLSG